MAGARLTGLLLLLLACPLHAETLICRGLIAKQWGYASIPTGYGSDCIITRRVGMQRIIDICGTQYCRVTAWMEAASPFNNYYVDEVLTVEIDVDRSPFEPARLVDPALD